MILLMILHIYVILSLCLVIYAYMCAILLILTAKGTHERDFTLREYLLAIITSPYSVFWEAAHDNCSFRPVAEQTR